jgi:predicted nuclease with RNAse H fold
MLTVGIDLAARPERTAVARIVWQAGRAAVTELRLGADDDALVEAISGADKAGIDCPLGWPADFVAYVAAHHAGVAAAPAESFGSEWRRLLTTRLTDRVVRDSTGITPLSVAADRIGHVALRCAALTAQLARNGHPVDRCGTGVVVEVYPAASLRRWGFPDRGYKRPGDVSALGQMVDHLTARAPWLDLESHEPACRELHDAFDAVIAALTARAAALALTTPPGEDQIPVARSEGWIALPEPDSWGRLA